MSPVFTSTQRPKQTVTSMALSKSVPLKKSNIVEHPAGIVPLVNLPDSQEDMFELYSGMCYPINTL